MYVGNLPSKWVAGLGVQEMERATAKSINYDKSQKHIPKQQYKKWLQQYVI
jgi:hypothetical protein